MGHNQILQVRRQARRQERLEARVGLKQKRLIERAAQIRGTSVTDFVLASAQQAAMETIKDFQMLSLRDKARRPRLRLTPDGKTLAGYYTLSQIP